MLPSLNVKLYEEAKHSYWCITYRIKSALQMKELRRSLKKYYFTQRYFLSFYCQKGKDHVVRIRNLTTFCEYITCAFPRMCIKTFNGYTCNSTIALYGIHCKKVNHWFHSPRKGATENAVI